MSQNFSLITNPHRPQYHQWDRNSSPRTECKCPSCRYAFGPYSGMAAVEELAAECAAEVTKSLAARETKGGRKAVSVAPQYHGRHALKCEADRTAAPAPAATIRSAKRATVRPYTVPRGWVSPDDLLSRCHAAARLTLTGRNWSADDSAECAADILRTTLEKHPLKDGYTDPTAASMARLCHLAANWRRGEDRQRKRDAQDAADRGSIAGKVYAKVDGGTVATPMHAARRAIEALQNLGLDATAARRVWPLAYTAARRSGDATVEGAELAAELTMSHAAYRQALSRAAGYVPSAAAWKDRSGTEYAHARSYTDHLEAVCAECEAIATDPRSVATDAADGPDWPARSASHYKGAAVSITRDASVKRDGRRNYPPAAWTDGLGPRTRRRLETAAAMRRARAAARTDEEVSTRRLAAGLAG